MTPEEFTYEEVKLSSGNETIYGNFLNSGEPLRSIFKNNSSWKFLPPNSKLEWGKGYYYDTTIGSKHPYWCNIDLPKPTKNIHKLRTDIKKWGYCLVENALSTQQVKVMKERVYSQMEGENLAGIPCYTQSGQNINTLINKGSCFSKCIEHHPSAIQAGPLIEQLISDVLGKRWICNSFFASGSKPGGLPQFMHQDQHICLPHQILESPLLFNTLLCVDDMDEHNGGTLIIPGSHQIFDYKKPLPPTINLDAKAGTAVLFDGRLWHATGANKTNKFRFVCIMSCIKSWMRQQENWILSVKPQIINSASPKLLHRLGFQAQTSNGIIEGFGMNSSGKINETSGSLKLFRQDNDNGSYIRVEELNNKSSLEELNKKYTIRKAISNIVVQYNKNLNLKSKL